MEDYVTLDRAGQNRTTFVDRVSGLLARVEYRRAETPEERDAIFRQRYIAYTREGAIEPNADARFTDDFDEAPNAHIVGIYLDNELCASMRVHVSTVDYPRIPALWAFSDHLLPVLETGKCIVDPTRFVVDYEFSRRNPELAYLAARIGWIAGEHFHADIILSCARAEHHAFYKRTFGYELIAPCRPYKTLTKPVGLMFLDFPKQRQPVSARYPFLRSTADERERLFGRSGDSVRLVA